jgi:predicted metal-dependent peptidase
VITMQTPADQLIKRARALLFGLGWKHPFFLLPSQKVYIRVATLVPTACVDASGCMYLNPQFCGQLSDEHLTFVLAHELMHLLLFHFARRSNRKPQRWNRAGDRVINHGLTSLGLKMPPQGLLPEDSAHYEYTTEEMYEVEDEQESDSECPQPSNMPGATGGCGVLPPQASDGDQSPGEGEAPTDGKFPDEREAARNWRQMAAQAEHNARSAGDKAADILGRILHVPPSRVKWQHILRGACARALAERGRDDVSWSRRNRRSFGGEFILPGGITYRAQVAVAVDTSGSVSDESLEQAVSEIESISAATRVAIFLTTHDAEVHYAGWVRPGARRDAVAKTMIGRGGTLFTPAYEAIEKASKKFDHAVHLTDGMPCEEWPERPRNCRKLVVALIGCKATSEVPADATVVEAEI